MSAWPPYRALLKCISRFDAEALEYHRCGAEACKRRLKHVRAGESSEPQPGRMDSPGKSQAYENNESGKGEHSTVQGHDSLPSDRLGFGRRAQVFAHPGEECAGWCKTRSARNDPSTPEQQKGGDAGDAKVANRRAFAGVQLEQARLAGKRSGGGGKVWRHRPAGTAPGSPDIDQHQAIRAFEVSCESVVVDLRRVIKCKRVGATLAFCCAGVMRRCNAVRCSTMSAIDLLQLDYVSAFSLWMPSVSMTSFS